MNYSEERQIAVMKKLQGTNSLSVPELAKREGIAKATLYRWQANFRSKGLLQSTSSKEPSGWSSARKFSAVLATASMSEVDVSTYCREHGIFPGNIEEWKKACLAANDWDRSMNVEIKKKLSKEKEKVKALSKELNRKEKALAETAALLVLEKKTNIFCEKEEEV